MTQRNHKHLSIALWPICFLMALLALRLTQVDVYAVSAYNTIQGESFDEDKSKGVSTSWENGSDNIQSLGWIDSGDYACYKGVSFSNGVSSMKIRYSKKIIANVDIKVLLDSPSGQQIASIALSTRTGANWTDFVTTEFNINANVSGTHDVYLKFSSLETSQQLLHIDWFVFGASKSQAFLPPAGLTITDPKTGLTYKVLSDQKSAEVIGVPKSAKLLVIEDTLTLTGTYDGGTVEVSLKIKRIASNAAKNCTKLEVAYFGANLTTIKKNAFKGCKKLNTLVFMGTAAKSGVKTSAFYDIKKKATFYVPAKNLKYFKKMFKADAKTKAKKFAFEEYKAAG